MLKKTLCLLGGALIGALHVIGIQALSVRSVPVDIELREEVIGGMHASSVASPKASDARWSASVELKPGAPNYADEALQPVVVPPEPQIVVPDPTVVVLDPIVVPLEPRIGRPYARTEKGPFDE
jgi:hypothetical protein